MNTAQNDTYIVEKMISNAEHAARLATTDIVPRFSTSDKYTKKEQITINKALAILASKLVSQKITTKFVTSQAVKNFLQIKLATCEREVFAVLFLNNEHRLIEYEEMNVGTLDASSVYPREIVKRAIYHNAAAMILVHNHPSGTPTPSAADHKVTNAIVMAAALFQITVLDHIIVSVADTTSFKENGGLFQT